MSNSKPEEFFGGILPSLFSTRRSLNKFPRPAFLLGEEAKPGTGKLIDPKTVDVIDENTGQLTAVRFKGQKKRAKKPRQLKSRKRRSKKRNFFTGLEEAF
jgi:hypothetical protein